MLKIDEKFLGAVIEHWEEEIRVVSGLSGNEREIGSG